MNIKLDKKTDYLPHENFEILRPTLPKPYKLTLKPKLCQRMHFYQRLNIEYEDNCCNNRF